MRRYAGSFEGQAGQAIHKYRGRRAAQATAVGNRGPIGRFASAPGNRLEALKGNRAGQHSIRVNDQFRVCFRWTDTGAEDVEIVDYH